MNKNLNLAQTFVTTKAFLDIIFFKNYSEDVDSSGLDIVIAGFAINKCKQDWQLEPETWDPSVWIDWMKSANLIIAPEIADPTKTLVSPLQGYQIMKKYIDNFGREFEFKDLLELFKSLDIDHFSDFTKSKEWKMWLLCVDSTTNNSLSVDGSIISLDEKIVSKQQSLQITQFFLQKNILLLDDALQESVKKLHFKKSEDDVFLNTWSEVYNKFVNNQDGKIKIIDAYNIMRLSLEKYLKHDASKLYAIKELLSVDDQQIPIKYTTWFSWLNAVYTVILY